MTFIEKNIQNRILEISKKYHLSHIGSNLSCLPILIEIYKKKKPDDIVILSNAHAHLAHLVARENYEGLVNIEALLQDYGIHCDRQAGCDVSGGSLGHALGIGIGRAIADPNRKIYIIISDGSFHEGSEMEALRILNELQLNNIEIHANFNGYTATRKVNLDYLENIARTLYSDIIIHHTSNTAKFDGVQGHYMTL